MKIAARHGRRGMRIASLLLAAAFLASSGLANAHVHADGNSAATDCVACVVGINVLLNATAPPPIAPCVVETRGAGDFADHTLPDIPFARPCGLRDPPIHSA
jgi:hypothetical protein